MSAYAGLQAIVERMRLEMPLEVTVPDVVTGELRTYSRANVLALLTLDTERVFVDTQPMAALFFEAARMRRSLERAAEAADRDFIAWKSRVSSEFREQASKAGSKAPTVDAVKDAYRQHDEYGPRADAVVRLQKLAGLFEDLGKAFDYKVQINRDQSRLRAGSEHVMRNDDAVDSLAASRALERAAEEVTVRSGAAAAAADYVEQLAKSGASPFVGRPPAPPKE